jgi:hypothetical protein
MNLVSFQWFGNMATMKWWDDLWLNEGFASTLMYFAMNDIFPDWKVVCIMNFILPRVEYCRTTVTNRRSDESRTTATALRLSCYIVDDVTRPNMAASSFSATLFWPNLQ